MALSTALPDAIQWYEGMMMSPQHFQQNELFWQEHLRHRLHALNPHAWGVLHLRYSLAGEVVTISELECILPDGLAVQFGPASPYRSTSLCFDAAGKCADGGAPLRLWLSVRPRSDKAAVAEAPERRYNSVRGGRVNDENTGADPLPIERLQVQFEPHLGSDCPSHAIGCPLLELRRVGNLLEVTGYHPPMLQLQASLFQRDHHKLARKLAQLSQALWDKLRELAGDPAGRAAAAAGQAGPERNAQFAAAHKLGACLPLLSLSLAPCTHPADLYRMLAQVVGQVAAIGPDPLPLRMGLYQHDNCMPQFQAAIDFILARLALLDTSNTALPFALLGPDALGVSRFERALPPDAGELLVIGLAADAGQTDAAMAGWLDNAVILGAALHQRLEASRIQGALVRLPRAGELDQYSLPPHALIRVIENQAVALPEGSRPAFSAGQALVIAGVQERDMPGAITLYRKKAGARGAAPAAALASGAAHVKA